MIFPRTVLLIRLKLKNVTTLEGHRAELSDRHHSARRLLSVEAYERVLLTELKGPLEHEVLNFAKVDDHVGVGRTLVLEVSQD